MVGVGRWGCVASLAAACSVPNPAFDPPREKDTESLPPDDDDGGETIEPSSEGGEETTRSHDETGSPPAVCNNEPEAEVGLRIFSAGEPVQRCGMVTERECVLTRNESQARWELTECCLTDDFCAADSTYVIEFAPTGPAVVAEPQLVSIRFAFTPNENGCKLEWVQIDDRDDALPPEVPSFIYLAAASLQANEFVSVHGQAGEVLPDEVCECAEVDADCCPDDLGRHSLHLTLEPSVITLEPTSPAHVEPIPRTDVAIELLLVRAWQPPACEGEAQYQWIVRRLPL